MFWSSVFDPITRQHIPRTRPGLPTYLLRKRQNKSIHQFCSLLVWSIAVFESFNLLNYWYCFLVLCVFNFYCLLYILYFIFLVLEVCSTTVRISYSDTWAHRKWHRYIWPQIIARKTLFNFFNAQIKDLRNSWESCINKCSSNDSLLLKAAL